VTNAEAARRAARLAGFIAEWAGDAIDLADARDDRMHDETLDRFLRTVRQWLDYMEIDHRGEPAGDEESEGR
jgi:hypothetical protein